MAPFRPNRTPCRYRAAAPGDERLMAALSARLGAAQLLYEILEKRRTLDEAMPLVRAFDRLSGADRAFARAMTSAALRQLGRLDEGLQAFLERPLEAAPAEARALLRIGAAQLWLMESAAHAAVGETVAAAKEWPGARRAAGFVNAVLRKASENRAAFDETPAEAIWPVWLRQAMRISLGDDAQRLAIAQMTEPELHLSARDDPARVAEAVGGATLPSGAVRAPDGAVVEAMPDYSIGTWWVQDQAAALPAKLLGAGDGETVFDLCAAPGGKTMQLAAGGAKVVAIDRSAARLRRLKKNLKRTALSDQVTVRTGLIEDWRPDAPAAYILLDAPCSALGTLRRHPEGAWIKSPAKLAGFPKVQSRLLAHALAQLGIGGTLVYCVCTPLSQEGEAVVAEALTRSGVERRPIAPEETPGFEDCVTEKGDVVTLPTAERACDAFYIARLTRM